MPAAGYRSITVHQKYYDALRIIADQKDISVTELIERLIDQYSRPYIRAMIDEIAAKERDFKEPYHAFVLDSKIKHYKSTAWVRTEDYVKRMRDPMLGDLADRIRKDDEFNIDKIFILSQNSWSKREVWKWISDWLTFGLFREKQIRIFVLKQKIADKILATMEKDDQKRKQYYDMGIYGEARDKPDSETVVGYLEIDSQSRPGKYKRISSCDDAEEVKRAERHFGELKKGAQAIESSGDIEKLQQQLYD
jgi:hypothetical protein